MRYTALTLKQNKTKQDTLFALLHASFSDAAFTLRRSYAILTTTTPWTQKMLRLTVSRFLDMFIFFILLGCDVPSAGTLISGYMARGSSRGTALGVMAYKNEKSEKGRG